jgi:hypothetical protein
VSDHLIATFSPFFNKGPLVLDQYCDMVETLLVSDGHFETLRRLAFYTHDLNQDDLICEIDIAAFASHHAEKESMYAQDLKQISTHLTGDKCKSQTTAKFRHDAPEWVKLLGPALANIIKHRPASGLNLEDFLEIKFQNQMELPYASLELL